MNPLISLALPLSTTVLPRSFEGHMDFEVHTRISFERILKRYRFSLLSTPARHAKQTRTSETPVPQRSWHASPLVTYHLYVRCAFETTPCAHPEASQHHNRSRPCPESNHLSPRHRSREHTYAGYFDALDASSTVVRVPSSAFCRTGGYNHINIFALQRASNLSRRRSTYQLSVHVLSLS